MIKKAVYIEKAPAKINLFLEVLGKRPDGYHNISTIFQAVDLMDQLTFEFHIEVVDPGFPLPEELSFHLKIDSNSPEIIALGATNILTTAVETYFSNLPEAVLNKVSKTSMEVYLHKNIPMEAGLAGGSADAAATLRAINRFFGENLSFAFSQKELALMAAEIGSDVPFCLYSVEQPRIYAESCGDEFKDLDINPEYDRFSNIILVKPQFGIETATAYELIDQKSKPGAKPCSVSEQLFFNRFEEVIFAKYPELLKIKDELLKLGCQYAILSGSGSTVLGFLDEKNNIEQLYSNAQKAFPSALVSKTSFLRIC